MGVVIPRPPMRRAEARQIRSRLKRHSELMAAYISRGFSKDDASRKAFNDVRVGCAIKEGGGMLFTDDLWRCQECGHEAYPESFTCPRITTKAANPESPHA